MTLEQIFKESGGKEVLVSRPCFNESGSNRFATLVGLAPKGGGFGYWENGYPAHLDSNFFDYEVYKKKEKLPSLRGYFEKDFAGSGVYYAVWLPDGVEPRKGMIRCSHLDLMDPNDDDGMDREKV